MGKRASDIHVEVMGAGSRVRLRIDGALVTSSELPAGTHRAAISRVKIMAGLDISVRRRPQDGGFTIQRGGAQLTVRVSTIPTHEGEKAVLRLLDPGDAPPDLPLAGAVGHRSGAAPADSRAPPGGAHRGGTHRERQDHHPVRERWRSWQPRPSTSSRSKTRSSTASPASRRLKSTARRASTFPSGLRAILRQDPDVILVGEVRDRETAEIAMSAAVTGHLVLTTIHTVDAPSAVARLVEMGVPPFLVAGGLAGVVAQRLVRKLCSRCWGRDARQCPACTDGYRGRSGVFEVLAVDDEIRSAVSSGASVSTLRTLARRNGMGSMARDARRQAGGGRDQPPRGRSRDRRHAERLCVVRALRGAPAAKRDRLSHVRPPARTHMRLRAATRRAMELLSELSPRSDACGLNNSDCLRRPDGAPAHHA